jgi:hypothetical protein
MIRQLIWLLLMLFVGGTDPAEENLYGVALQVVTL